MIQFTLLAFKHVNATVFLNSSLTCNELDKVSLLGNSARPRSPQTVSTVEGLDYSILLLNCNKPIKKSVVFAVRKVKGKCTKKHGIND